MTIEVLVIVGGMCLVTYRLVAWVSAAPRTPDPWSHEVEQGIRDCEATVVCHRCLTPQPPHAWFCTHCGTAVGDFNNYMPFVRVFSEGEVFRAGVADRLRPSPLVILGFLLCSLVSYSIFAPVYWVFLIRNLRRWALEKDGDAVQKV